MGINSGFKGLTKKPEGVVTFTRLLLDLGERTPGRYWTEITWGPTGHVEVLETKSCLCQESNYESSVVLPLALYIILITLSRPCSFLTPGPHCLLRS